MAKEPQITLSIDTPSESFKTHLEGNERILFSAPFGTGKTYFLKHFFKFDDIAAKYNVFHLFPVNYQVASNEDIFDLVKYDLLYNMLLKGWINTETDEIPKMLAVQSYLMTKSPTLLSNIMKCVPVYHIDKATEASGHIMKLINKFAVYYAELNDGKFTEIKDFVSQITNRSGSIYEMDAISNLIYDTLQANKGDNDEKENVLIIDDLDRIDPEHIFRLLNVFSAHFDLPTDEENKFGFDKVIFVCDVENIRNIFAAKYGQYTDFSGYIDKFYSSTIYTFDNVQEALNILQNWSYSVGKKCLITPFNFSLVENYGKELLSWFFESRSINLRQFYTLFQFQDQTLLYDYHQKKKNFKEWQSRYLNRFLFVDLIHLLLVIFGGDKYNLKQTLTRTSRIETSQIISDSYIRNLLPILVFEEVSISSRNMFYKNEDLRLQIDFQLQKEDYWYGLGKLTDLTGNGEVTLHLRELMFLFQEALDVMDKHGLI